MTDSIFLAGIEHLTFQATPGRGDAVGNAFWITTDASFISGLIPQEVRASIGRIELASLTSGRPVAYTRVSNHSFESDTEAQRDLVNWLRLITLFLQQVWFIFDNVAGLEFGYVIWSTRGHIGIARNFLSLVSTEADLKTETKQLSVDDFRQIRERFTKCFLASAASGAKKTKATRLDRATYFVQAARGAEHAPVKIANYCSALESLFSNDSTELSHKLSERVGMFIGRNADERLQVFQRLKKAYGIRSKVVHGAAEWGDVKLATETSRFLDDVVRRAFNRITSSGELSDMFISDSESGRRNHEQFLLGLVFGTTSFSPD